MAEKIIQIPNVGNIAFPDSMSDDDISTAIRKNFGGGPAPDTRSATTLMQDQAAQAVRGAVGDDLALHPLDTLSAMGKQFKEHPVSSAADALWGMVKGAAAIPAKAAYHVTTETLPGLARDTGALVEAYGGPQSPFASPTREGQEAAAHGAGEALAAAPVIAGDVALAKKGLSAIPTRAKAGAKFEQVMSKAKDVPLDLKEADDIIARAQELRQRGSTLPKVLNDYTKARKTGAPMTYEAGRDFASNAGALSAREATALNAKMQRQVAQFAKAMKTANREAAASVGMGDLYDAAMREYRQASSLAEAGQIIKKYGIRVALTGAGLGAGAELLSRMSAH